MMYIISDNAYFSYGFCELLKEGGRSVKNLQLPLEKDLVEKFNENDFILLVIEDLYLLDKLVSSLPSYVMALIFIDGPHFYGIKNLASKIDGKSTCYMKSISLSILFFLEEMILDNKLSRDFNSLTPKERIIMHGLMNGVSVWKIALRLGVDVKTISTYKMSSLRKLGLVGMNARALYIYKIIAATNRFSTCIHDPIIKQCHEVGMERSSQL